MIKVFYFSVDNAVDISAEVCEVCMEDRDLLGDLPSALVIKPGYYTIWRGGGAFSAKRRIV